jgi:hypothetical protein
MLTFFAVAPELTAFGPGRRGSGGRSDRQEEIWAMPDRMAERRAAPRYPLILIAEVTELPSGTKLSARTSDVSRTGCYIDMLNPIPPGSKIRLKLFRDDGTFEVIAKVIYISQGLGMGVAFEEHVPADRLAILDRWLEAAARQPT